MGNKRTKRYKEEDSKKIRETY